MLLDELYNYYRSWARMCRAIGIDPVTRLTWTKQGYIPYRTQCVIQVKTNGMFLAKEEHGKPKRKKI